MVHRVEMGVSVSHKEVRDTLFPQAICQHFATSLVLGAVIMA